MENVSDHKYITVKSLTMAELGLASAAAGASQLKSILNLAPEEKGRPKFGSVVDPQKEGKCPYIEVFMAAHVRGEKWRNIISESTELRRGRFKPTDTPLDARDGFGDERGKPISQEDIRDENGYILGKELTTVPMSQLSNGCRLNLSFVYRRDAITDAVVSAETKITDTVNAATNTPKNWLRGWTTPSQSTESSNNDE